MAYIDQDGYRERRLRKKLPVKTIERAKKQRLGKTLHDTKFRDWANLKEEALGITYRKGRTEFRLKRQWDSISGTYIHVAETDRKAWGRRTIEKYDLRSGNRITKYREDKKGINSVTYWPDGGRRIRYQSKSSNHVEDIDVSLGGDVTTRLFRRGSSAE